MHITATGLSALRGQMCCCAIAWVILGIQSLEAAADSAMSADPSAPNSFLLGVERTAGWQFTVNAPLLVTHLGLYDWHADGFELDYPIGIWDEEGNLLTSATIPNGAVAPFADGFRHVPAALTPVLLPGETFTIGYFASAIAPDDLMISQPGHHTVHAMINQLPGSVVTSEIMPMLSMPDSPFPFAHWVGPTFQFQVVPGPAAAWLFVGAGLITRFRRMRWSSWQASA